MTATPGLAVGGADEAARRTALARMRWTATGVLGGMLAALGVSALLQPAFPALQWVRAFAEAGAVGALADWYAVVALFRRPLGLPIPHTGIIPANKDRIGETLGQFVEQNFLTPENVVSQLDPPALANAMAAWLADADNSRALAASICDFVPGLLDAVGDEDVQPLLERVGRRPARAARRRRDRRAAARGGGGERASPGRARPGAAGDRALAGSQSRAHRGEVRRGLAVHADDGRRVYRRPIPGRDRRAAARSGRATAATRFVASSTSRCTS